MSGMRIHVDPWSPSYGMSVEQEDGPSESSSAQLDTDVELPADEWRPLTAPAGLPAPNAVLVVDGVRRIDAHLSVDTDAKTYRGIAASYAAGVVRCDLRAGVAELAGARIERGLFTSAPDVESIGTAPTRYNAEPVDRTGPNVLVQDIQAKLTALEIQVSSAIRGTEDLLVVDGPLRGRAHLPNMLGYIKTHQRQYLPDRLSSVVTGLHPGQRSPVFLLGTNWSGYTWYLRLPGPVGSAWAGIVRIECPADLAVPAVIDLANLSAVTLPRFASCAYKDPRAPQNLVPIAGLERRLRALLGDARLLHRALVRATSDTVPV